MNPPQDAVPERQFGWWDMFVHPDEDPRQDGDFENTERGVLTGFLSDRRLTLQLKCEGLNAEQMARQSVPPSDLSMLGLVRHLAGVERNWMRNVVGGQQTLGPYVNDEGVDLEFVVRPDADLVEEAWRTWSLEVEHSVQLIDGIDDLGELGKGRPVPVREVLVHLIREYAQHLGHADLIRERIDGRVGQ